MANKGVRFEMARGAEDSRTMIHLVQGFMQRVDILRRQTRGVIMEKTRGVYIMKPGFVQQPENVAALQQVLSHFLQLMNDAMSLGIVKMDKS